MAIYTYWCRECGSQAEVYQSISAYSIAPDVPICSCHKPMERRITAPMLALDIAPWAAYQSPIDGEIIDSKSKRNEHMARHGVVMFDEIAPDIERNKARMAQAAVADLKDDLVAAVHKVEAGHKPQVIHEAEFIPAE